MKLVRPFVGGKRAEITSTPKVYFIDNGIRNRLFGGFAPLEGRAEKEALLKNYVFKELYKSIHPLLDAIHFWRSKSGAEVDFVIRKDHELFAVEVKAGPTRGKLTRSAQSFIDAYQPNRFVVVGDRVYPPLRKGTTDVIFTTPTDLRVVFHPSATGSS